MLDMGVVYNLWLKRRSRRNREKEAFHLVEQQERFRRVVAIGVGGAVSL